MAVNAVQTNKTVSDPLAAYLSILPLWKKNRAVAGGERFAKEYDGVLDVNNFTNLLVPFSPSMTPKQYDFYKAEAELPGIVSQYTKMVIGGLLRKKPLLDLPEGVPEGAKEWIISKFGEDDGSLTAFLDTALWEELQTSRCWVQIDYPKIPDRENLTREELLNFKPYPIIWNAESVINWTVNKHTDGKLRLTRVIIRTLEEDFGLNEFHAELIPTIVVHELVNNKYRIRKYRAKAAQQNVPVVNGKRVPDNTQPETTMEVVETIEDIEMNGERLSMIPLWPLNGSIEIVEPVLTALVDKEVSLYNKLSRRNHLLYGAATYTPVICTDMLDDEFKELVNSGLGTWLKIRKGDTATILETPTAALADMDRAIAASLEEMAKLGVRMLTPETAQSGIALELRNAAQTAQLGTLNTKVSTIMSDIIAFMLNWRYGTEYSSSDIKFSMSADFNPSPMGDMWLRLVTEWYQAGLIPRSIWLQILKQNDIVPPEYDDKDALAEISADQLVITPAEQTAMMDRLQQDG